MIAHTQTSLEKGQGLIEYVILLALVSLVTIGAVAVTGEGTSDLMGDVVDSLTAGPQEHVEEGSGEAAGEQSYTLTVKVVDQNGSGIQDVPILAFDGQGNFLNLQQETNINGQTSFTDLGPGEYAFRADYRAREFWSEIIAPPPSAEVEITIESTGFAVAVVNASGEPLAGVTVAAFSGIEGDYAGITQRSDVEGVAGFRGLATGQYAFRADYLGQTYWSEVVDTMQTGQATITITILQTIVSISDRQGDSVSGVPVYAYTANDDFTGLSSRSSKEGAAALDLPEGTYKFRADYDGHAYWSDLVTLPGASQVAMQVGPYDVSVAVVDQLGQGLRRVNVIAYGRENDQPIFQKLTDKRGRISAALPPGDYYLRVYYDEREYRPPDFQVPATQEVRVELALASIKSDLVVQIIGMKNSRVANTYVLLYRNSGRYYQLIEWQYSDAEGQILFDDLEEGKYLVYVYDWNSYRWRWKYIHAPSKNPVTINVN